MNVRSLVYLYRLRKNVWLNPRCLQEKQQGRLKAIIKHSYENVPFYHRKFDAAGIKPDDIKSVADLSKIPLTTKVEIQATPLEDVVARNFDANKCIKRTTSGSTGVPLTALIDEKGQDFEDAVWVRALLENGLRLRDKMAVISDPRHFPKRRSLFERVGITRRKHISIFYDAERQMTLLEDYRPHVIKGYVSSLAILADEIERSIKNGMHLVEPRLVFTSAELLDSEDRSLISSAFRGEVLDNYACSEFSLLAWECCSHVGYHMNADSLIMEFLKNGETVAPGERGEIICTSLVNYGMPLVRYRLGDVGVPCEEQCSCGRTLPLMKIVEGRTDDFLVALDGKVISPTVFFPYPFENMEGIRQFRVIQERRDELKIQLVVRDNFLRDKEVLEKAKRKIKKVFGEEMNVEFQLLEKIDKDPTGKLRKILSRLPSAHRAIFS